MGGPHRAATIAATPGAPTTLAPIPAWLDNSYTSLAAAVLGVVVGAVVLRSLAGRPSSLAAATPVAAAVLVGVLASSGLWGGLRGLEGVRDGLALAPGISEREKCLLDGQHDPLIEVTRRLIGEMPAESRFALVGRVELVCFQLALLPRLMVQPGEPHDFTVYSDADLPDADRARLRAGDPAVTRVAPGFVLVREP